MMENTNDKNVENTASTPRTGSLPDKYFSELYKKETGEDSISMVECTTNCQFEDPIKIEYFNDEYVWWLEGKLKALMTEN